MLQIHVSAIARRATAEGASGAAVVCYCKLLGTPQVLLYRAALFGENVFCGLARRNKRQHMLRKRTNNIEQVRLICIQHFAYGWAQVGGQAGFYVPEDLALRHLSGPMAGLDVALNYAEWTIWDGRYATEMARANTRIARWERYTLEGKIRSDHVVIPGRLGTTG